ncbi:hypothetical protein [Xanthomonas albilineans]|uniref:Uncharacterized protein n=1 Tax=Xanthomonas albilineans (strain GPE PC73 / CFBP 7063) TaxID=380358 RepID=D2U873_XANAP|nr:hypothetical protein [Xanthomonas albilineans]CBA14775.1 hypothetical protein XALC_0230 [Xanthomonas albilineans GPE PC73]
MADIKISQLPDAATLDGTERFPVVQAGQNAKASPDQLASYAFGLLQRYIDGLKLEWVSTTSLRVTNGVAYVPSVKRIIALPQSVTMASLALDASAWYHCYLTAAAGIQLVKDAPDAAYAGVARTKTADSSCRYLGSVLTDSSGQIYNFLHVGNQIFYRNAQAKNPFRVLDSGTATSIATVSCAAVVPVTARVATLQLYNFASGVNMGTGTSDDSAIGPPSAPNDALYLIRQDATALVPHPLASDGSLQYWLTGTPTGGAGAYIDVFGYIYER